MSRSYGAVLVHGCIRAVCPHVEWTLSHELGRDIRLDWTEQTARRGLVRAEYRWTGPAGTWTHNVWIEPLLRV